MKGQVKTKLQLLLGDEIAIGPGKADLLEAIGREGSISAAARALGMSYRRAWLLVDVMNRCWQTPLVTAVPGARRGAKLTDLGVRVLADYRLIEGDLARVADGAEARRLLSRLSG